MTGRSTKSAPRGAPKAIKATNRRSARSSRNPYWNTSGESSRQSTNQSPVANKPKHLGWKAVPKNAETIRTFKAQDSIRYYQQKRDLKDRYLGDPPQEPGGPKTVQARIVLPGQHKVPRDLDLPGTLDDIRRSCQVWIVHVQSNVLDVYATDVPDLRKAVTEINWAIHNLRLLNEHSQTLFIVQPPTEVDEDFAQVVITPNSRPYLEPALLDIAPSTRPSVEDVVSKMWFHMNPAEAERSLDAMRELEKKIRMRVNFGHFKVHEKKNSTGSFFTYESLPSFLNMYSTRETRGAELETGMPGSAGAQKAFRFLKSYFAQDTKVTSKCSAVFTIQKGTQIHELTSNIVPLHGDTQEFQFETPIITVPEQYARLNWVFVALDKSFDWNLRVDAWETVPDGPSIMDKVKLQASQEDYEGYFWFPRLRLEKLEPHKELKIQEIRLRSAFIIPHENPNWVIEIIVTKTWKGDSVSGRPDISWSLEMYGNQWEGIINTVTGVSKRKAWGQGFSDMWRGSSEDDFSTRFQEFLGAIVEVQGFLTKEETQEV